MLFGKPEYSQHVPVSAYEDTGERSGFVTSILPGLDGTDFEGGIVDNHLMPSDLFTGSVAGLGEMQGVQVASMPVTTEAERQTFRGMWPGYTGGGRRSGTRWPWT